MLSSSTKYDPSARCSATVVTAFTAMSARSSLWPLADLDDIEVIPTFFRVSSSLMEIFVATFSRTSWALSEAWRYPAAITVGWMFWSIRSSAFLLASCKSLRIRNSGFRLCWYFYISIASERVQGDASPRLRPCGVEDQAHRLHPFRAGHSIWISDVNRSTTMPIILYQERR